MQTADLAHVNESRFGVWFLGTNTWAIHVLRRAFNDLETLIVNPPPSYDVILDVGCGWGRSLRLLEERFTPRHVIGIDSDPEMLDASQKEIDRHDLRAELRLMSASHLSLPDASVDMIFCHQTLHHVVEQKAALQEFFRVLKPGGVLLLAESTRHYIYSWIICLLFRHEMSVQRSADEYLSMIRAAGFLVPENSISYPYLWWSRSDLGISEKIFRIAPPKIRTETLLNLVAVKAHQ
jgi:ubiquinone/menaquinone biosynthesis C-methylase UbiE